MYMFMSATKFISSQQVHPSQLWLKCFHVICFMLNKKKVQTMRLFMLCLTKNSSMKTLCRISFGCVRDSSLSADQKDLVSAQSLLDNK